MDKNDLKAMVAELLREMDGNEVKKDIDPAEHVTDLTALDLRKAYLVESPAEGEHARAAILLHIGIHRIAAGAQRQSSRP